jgi:hypothetical protein
MPFLVATLMRIQVLRTWLTLVFMTRLISLSPSYTQYEDKDLGENMLSKWEKTLVVVELVYNSSHPRNNTPTSIPFHIMCRHSLTRNDSNLQSQFAQLPNRQAH